MKFILFLFSFSLYSQEITYFDKPKCFVFKIGEKFKAECRNWSNGEEIVEISKEIADIEILDIDEQSKTAVLNPSKKAAKELIFSEALTERETKKLKEAELKQIILTKVKDYSNLSAKEKDELLEELIKKQFANDLTPGELDKK